MSSIVKCAKLKVMKKFFLALVISIFFLPSITFAQSACDGLGVNINNCQACMGIPPVVTGMVWTAIGCLNAGLPTGSAPGGSLIGQLLVWATILGSGFAFLIIVFGGFQIATAAGDPKKMKAAQELIWSGISGLLLIIFSIFLLNLIGFRILNLQPVGLPPAAI